MATEKNCVLTLPPEIWIHVLKSDILDDSDICRVSQVCRWLNEISNSDELWKTKFRQRWPVTAQLDLSLPSNCWRDLFRLRKQVHRQVEQQLKELAAEWYYQDELSSEEFECFLQAQELHEKGLHFVLEDFLAILDSPRYTRLTDKFYSKKVVRFLRQKMLKKEWAAFLSLPAEEQPLEKGARLVSSWMQTAKTVRMSDISAELDNIADRVRALLRSRSQGATVHPACEKDNSITGFEENLWPVIRCRQVLKALNEVLYTQMGFAGNNDEYYCTKNSYINEVLETKKGIPITLSIIYSAVARRLGVICEPINFPNHFLLVFKDYIGLQPQSLQQLTYIDAFNKGRTLTAQECVSILLNNRPFREDYFTVVTPHLVFERMARNLVCILRENTNSDETIPVFQDSVSLFLAISPNDQQMIFVYTNLCLHLNVNLPEVITVLASTSFGEMCLIRQCETQMRANKNKSKPEKRVKLRSEYPEVEFSLGMVMKHRKYAYTCVIYGWDFECKASQDWIRHMGVHLLPKGKHQPFYNVLVEDGSIRYAAQENLSYTREVREISHKNVGKYFQEFTGHRYIPNPIKHAEYPEDIAVTRMGGSNLMKTLRISCLELPKRLDRYCCLSACPVGF